MPTETPCQPHYKPDDNYVSLKEYFTLWLTKLDESVEKGFEAAQALNDQVNKAAQDAVHKAETAQSAYNTGHNDLLRKMDLQYRDTLPRSEAESKFKDMAARIDELKKDNDNLRTSRDQAAGITSKGAQDRSRFDFNLTSVIAIVATAIALFALFKRP